MATDLPPPGELGPKQGFSLLALPTCGGQSHKELLLLGADEQGKWAVS